MRRGYFAVGVWHPKREVNVGSIMRTAHLYGAAYTFTVGQRYERRQATDTSDSRKHVPMFVFDDIDDALAHLPYGCRLVGVELAPRATPLAAFEHPERVCYLFGAEDHGLPPEVADRCADLVQIEAVEPWSMNVANAAAIVMHHRHTSNVRAVAGRAS